MTGHEPIRPLSDDAHWEAERREAAADVERIEFELAFWRQIKHEAEAELHHARQRQVRLNQLS